ncbi:MAG: ABC transporter permease subunit [Gemmatimonadetes bacterium]|nr:ABC transporter permease subunit [Gemmatimonadota bacterium]
MTTPTKSALSTAVLICLALAACREAGRRCTGDFCGTAIIVTAADAGVLLPPLIRSNMDIAVSDLIFLKLADIGPSMNTIGDGGFIPRLARSWRFENPLTLAFDIDPRAKWQDGPSVTAADVAFTFDIYRDTLVNSPTRPLLERITSVTARDAHTAVFKFRSAYAEQFYDAAFQMRILPKHLLDSVPRARLKSHPFVRNPVGAGPYRFVRWRAGESIELAADTAFFLGRPGLARILWRVTPDFGAAVTQLVADEADIMEFLGGPENVARVTAAPQLRVVAYPSPALVFVQFNLRDPERPGRPHPLFGDRELRRALFMGVDRTSLVQAVNYRDYPTVQAIIFVMAVVFLSINLLVDLLYAWLDPRIRYA